MRRLDVLLPLLLVTFILPHVQAESPQADGFEAIFNGQNLTGWYGLNPHQVAKLEGEQRTKNLADQRSAFADHWRVENGELVNDGHGPYATTEREYGDIELTLEYKTVAGADSGIYLRGTPQVQIWDWHQPFDPKRPTRKPHLGSGGLFNNSPGASGRDPMQFADKPFGQWNAFRIRQIGDRTWVWLNDKLVVDNAVMENYWDRNQELPPKGPIMLQTHGGEIRWRNIFVREIDAEEAKRWNDAQARRLGTLSAALTMHASFDHHIDADFSQGDRTCYVRNGGVFEHAEPNDDAKIVPDQGRFGGALHFPKKSNYRPTFKGEGTVDYNPRDWDTTVAVWLKLDPDKDLEPGYCDPVQIVGNDSKKGFIFLEFSKDETPRFFRYAIRPLFEIWNPENQAWADIPFEKRPMIQVEKPPFSNDQWTHVAFTVKNVNNKQEAPSGELFINGQSRGVIDNWDLTFDWDDPTNVLVVLGASYVGLMDDFATFDRALIADEVMHIYRLEEGIAELYPVARKE
ncbi:MAG: family 16 glycoside hydrolase [Pirellulaceae bacterium]